MIHLASWSCIVDHLVCSERVIVYTEHLDGHECTSQAQLVRTNLRLVCLHSLLTSDRSDNETFTLDREVAEKSILIKNMIEDIGDSEEE